MTVPRFRLNGSIDLPLHQVRQQLGVLRHLAEGAQRKAELVNNTVDEIAACGLLLRCALLSDVIQQRPYPPVPGGHDSGEVLQAAILIPGGFGVVAWDSEEFVELQAQAESLQSEAWAHYVPFGQCEPALQGLAAREIDRLIVRLIEAFENST